MCEMSQRHFPAVKWIINISVLICAHLPAVGADAAVISEGNNTLGNHYNRPQVEILRYLWNVLFAQKKESNGPNK